MGLTLFSWLHNKHNLPRGTWILITLLFIKGDKVLLRPEILGSASHRIARYVSALNWQVGNRLFLVMLLALCTLVKLWLTRCNWGVCKLRGPPPLLCVCACACRHPMYHSVMETRLVWRTQTEQKRSKKPVWEGHTRFWRSWSSTS